MAIVRLDTTDKFKQQATKKANELWVYYNELKNVGFTPAEAWELMQDKGVLDDIFGK
jgi:hypothetical protein